MSNPIENQSYLDQEDFDNKIKRISDSFNKDKKVPIAIQNNSPVSKSVKKVSKSNTKKRVRKIPVW